MIKSELQQLIEFYELEKTSLETSIKEYLEDLEYKMAHYQLQGLKNVNKMLRTLRNLNDPLYNTRENLETEKMLFEKWLSEERFGKSYLIEKIVKINQLLDALDQQKTKQALDGQEFDDALFDMVEGKTKGFRFHLKKEAGFWIDFRTTNETTIIISVTPPEQITDDHFLTKSHIRGLTGLGFSFNTDTGTPEYIYNTSGFKNAIFVKTLISRILFDIFYYKEFDHPAFIENHL